jgi:hypothetical protein
MAFLILLESTKRSGSAYQPMPRTIDWDIRLIKSSHPPFLAQLLFALLTQPAHFAPSFSSGFKVVMGISKSSAAREDVYKREMFDFVVEAGGVEMSGRALPD